MADKQHRLAIQGELHRPERTGQGDPNDQSFAYLEDGQYYQDTDTGSLWRYDEADSAWYLLLDYDKESQKLKNVNTLNAFQNNVGKTTSSIGATGGNVGTVTSIPAYTYAQLREGEEIVVIDSSNDLNYIFFTVSADTNAGEVNIPVQAETTTKVLPEDSYIQMDASIIQSYFSVDPTKLEISFDKRSEATSFGYISETLIAAGTSKSTLAISKAGVTSLNPVSFSDNQLLQLQRRDGLTQEIVVNGDQTFTTTPFVLNVDTFTTEFVIAATLFGATTYVVEPAYKSSSRITLAEGLIELNAQNISTVSNSVAGINAYVNSTFATLNAFTEFQTDTSNALTSINSTTDNLSASINTSVQYEDAVAYIKLIAGNTGSEIILQGNQININGLVTFINDESNTTINGNVITAGSITASQINVANLFSESIEVGNVIKSNNHVTGSTGFAMYSNGEAEFRNVTVYGEVITAEGSQVDGQYVNNINAGNITAGTISADRIGADSITANKINITDLFSETIEVGNVIKSNNYSTGLTGFAVFSNGEAEFRNVTVDGEIITDTGSSIDGVYVSNINAGNIVAGSIDASVISVINLDADNITTGSIDANQITVSNINASEITAGTIDVARLNVNEILSENATVNGVLTIGATGEVSGDNFNLKSSSSNISGWEFQSGRLQSPSGNVRINSQFDYLQFFDGDDYILVDQTGIESFNESLPTSQKRNYISLGRGSVKVGNVAPSDEPNSSFVQIGSSGLNVYNLSGTISNDLEVGGNVTASYKSSDGSTGITATRSWYDSAAIETHSVTIKNGIITNWTVTS